MDIQKQIKERISDFHELELKLSKAGPAKSVSIIRRQSEIEEHYYADVSDLLEIISQQTAEIERLIEVMDRASDMLSHNNESYKILQSALLTTIQGVDNT